MPIYSEIINDKMILQFVEGCSHIGIIGCGACMNESLAYKHNLPIYDTSLDSLVYPFATKKELERISSLLTKNDYENEILYFYDIDGFICMENHDASNYLIAWKKTPDVILVLSCAAGQTAIQKIFPQIPIIRITNTIGFIAYAYRDTQTTRIIDKEHSCVILK